VPGAIVDLQSAEGVALVAGEWRYADAHLAGGVVEPAARAVDYDDADWSVLAAETMVRLGGSGQAPSGWYRIAITIPQRVGEVDPTGAAIVFETVVDGYAEVWVNGELSVAAGQTGGRAVGSSAAYRVVLTREARPGDRFQIAVFGTSSPISTARRGPIRMRATTLDVYSDAPVAEDLGDGLERIATGFEFTEGPVWVPDGALLFSSPRTNSIYHWRDGVVTLFRPKSGYTGADVSRYGEPGSNGLALSPDGLLAICQQGNRRVVRIEGDGTTTVLADRYEGKRLNSPNDLVYRSDGTLFFTDPPFNLPRGAESELGFSGVFAVRDGDLTLVTDELEGPNGLAFSPDERLLYVCNWMPERKIVLGIDMETDARSVVSDMTDAPGEEAPDGMTVDPEGRLYVCGPGGIWVLTPAGEHLETLRLPESASNVAWGDEDRRTLYITAQTSVYRTRIEPDRWAVSRSA
jgi:gluconolactonase